MPPAAPHRLATGLGRRESRHLTTRSRWTTGLTTDVGPDRDGPAGGDGYPPVTVLARQLHHPYGVTDDIVINTDSTRVRH